MSQLVRTTLSSSVKVSVQKPSSSSCVAEADTRPERKIRKLAKESKVKGFLVRLNTAIAALVIGPKGKNLKHLENITKKYIDIQGDPKLPINSFIVVAEGSIAEIKEAAKPFKIGDILDLLVEEPYLYNKSDAISRVNGFVIQIIEGAKHLDQRLKVEIKSISRTSAVAEICD